MAESYISELGDKLSHGVANTDGRRVKIIAPKVYDDGNGNHPSISTALSGKASSTHTHGNIANGGTLTDTAAAAAGNDYVVIRDADNAKIQTSTIKGTDVADAVSKKHSHSTLTLSTTAQAYDGTHTLALPASDPYTSARTPASHTHGNMTNYGVITGSEAIANGDAIVVANASDSNKLAKTTVTFDGSTTTTALTPKGTFESFAKASDISTAIQALDVSSVGGAGKYISAISETDGKISATATMMDTTPTASSTNAVTSGGIKTALDGKANDSDVVHKTGTETVSGAKTFSNTSSVFDGKCANDINGVPLSSAYGVFRTELGNPTLEERGIIEETFANQLECLPKDKIVYETSPKGTETWTTLAVSDSTHNLLWGGNVTGSLSISKTVDFRITINAPSYCYLNFLYFYASGNGATFHIKLEKKLNSSGAWSVVSDTAETSIGWPGHNTIRHSNLAFSPTSSSQYGSVRLTLYIVSTGNIESYPTYHIDKFRYYGGYPYKADPWIVKNGSSGVTNFPKGITSGVAIPVGSGGTGVTSVTSSNFLVGNGTSAMVEKTPAQVLSLIGAQAAMTEMTTQEVTDFLTELGDF